VFKAGPSEVNVSHNQKDHLSFQIWAKGAWITGDPGYSSSYQEPDLYHYAEEAIGHSTILVDSSGPQQKYGAFFTRVAGGFGYGIICGEAAHTYLSPTVISVERCVLLHPDGFVILFDSVDTSIHSLVEWLIQPALGGFALATTNGGELYIPGARLVVHPIGISLSTYTMDIARTRGWSETLIFSTGLSQVAFSINLLDPGFEESTEQNYVGWQPRSINRSAHGVDSIARSGNQAGHITFTEKSSGYFYSERITVQPGEQIRASVYIRTEDVVGDGARIRLIFWANDEYHSDVFSGFANGSWSWHQRVASGIVPEEVNQVTVALEFSECSGSVWFDDVSVHKVAATDVKPNTFRLATLLYPTSSETLLLNGNFNAGFASTIYNTFSTPDRHGGFPFATKFS
jgi:hypothetical protein